MKTSQKMNNNQIWTTAEAVAYPLSSPHYDNVVVAAVVEEEEIGHKAAYSVDK